MTRAALDINLVKLYDAWNIYNADSSLRSELRFGQYCYNKFAVSGSAPWSRLFYEKDNGEAYNMLSGYIITEEILST